MTWTEMLFYSALVVVGIPVIAWFDRRGRK